MSTPIDAKKKAFELLLAEKPGLAQQFLSRVEQTEKEADASGVSYKETALANASIEELLAAITARTTTVKHATEKAGKKKMPAFIQEKIDAAEEEDDEDEDTTEDDDEEETTPPARRKKTTASTKETAEEEEADRAFTVKEMLDAIATQTEHGPLLVADLRPGEFVELVQHAIANSEAITTTKEAAEADGEAIITSLKEAETRLAAIEKNIKTIAGGLGELLGHQPKNYYQPSQASNNRVTVKQQEDVAEQEDGFDAIFNMVTQRG